MERSQQKIAVLHGKKMKHGGPASGRFANFRIEQIGCILFYEGGCDWKR